MQTETAALNRLPSRIALPEGVRDISVGHDVTNSGTTTLVVGWGQDGEAWILSTSYAPHPAIEPVLAGTGYRNALSLVRMGHASAAAISAALGSESPDGEEGNIWNLFDARLKTYMGSKHKPAFPPARVQRPVLIAAHRRQGLRLRAAR